MNYIKNNIKIYINSFKNKNILLIIVLNALFVLITAAAVKLIKLLSKEWIDKLNKIDLTSIAFQSEAQLQSTITTIKGFALFAILAALLFALFLIINWSFFQGIIWNILLEKKFNLKYSGKFLLLNTIWFLPWLILFLVILFGTKLASFAVSSYILILSFLHFSFILYVLFTKENKFREIKKALKLGILKIHRFILPYFFISITFIIIYKVCSFAQLGKIFNFLIYLIFFSWLQSYIKNIILDVSKA